MIDTQMISRRSEPLGGNFTIPVPEGTNDQTRPLSAQQERRSFPETELVVRHPSNELSNMMRVLNNRVDSEVSSSDDDGARSNQQCRCLPILVVDDHEFNVQILKDILKLHFKLESDSA